MDDLENGCTFRARARKRAHGRRRRQPLEIAVRLKRAARDAAARRSEHALRVACACRVGEIARRDRPTRNAGARGTAGGKHAFEAVRQHADAHARAVERQLSPHGVRAEDGVAFAGDGANSADGIGRQPHEGDERQRRDGAEPRRGNSRLHTPARGVGDFDRRAARGEPTQRVVGHRVEKNIDLHFAGRIDAKLSGPHRVTHRVGQRGRQRRRRSAG